jgi:hypothetical protein
MHIKLLTAVLVFLCKNQFCKNFVLYLTFKQNRNNMKRLFFVMALSAISLISVKAQDNYKPVFSIGVDAGIPTTKGLSFVIGGSLQGDFKVASDLALTASAGYKSWQAKNGGGSTGFIPVLGGIKYYFAPEVYGSGQLGVSFSTANGGGSWFTYAPGIGFKVSPNFDILAKYTGMSKNSINFNEVGVRLAYAF